MSYPFLDQTVLMSAPLKSKDNSGSNNSGSNNSSNSGVNENIGVDLNAFKQTTIVIPKSNLPISWLYVRYPILQVLFPYNIPHVKFTLADIIKNYDLQVMGAIASVNDESSEPNTVIQYIHGNFTVTTVSDILPPKILNNKNKPSITKSVNFSNNEVVNQQHTVVTGTAIYDVQSSDNYLDGQYIIMYYDTHNKQHDKGGLVCNFDTGVVSGYVLNIVPYYYDICVDEYDEDGYILSENVYELQSLTLIDDMLDNMSSAINLINDIDESKIIKGSIYKYDANGGIIKTVVIANNNDNDDNNNNSGETKITVYIKPYNEYTAGCKLRVVVNENYNFIQEQTILDIFDEPLIERTYRFSFNKNNKNIKESKERDEPKPDMKSDFGYLGKIQSFGINSQYDQFLVPELNQQSLQTVSNNGIINITYTPTGGIDTLLVRDQTGGEVLRYPN